MELNITAKLITIAVIFILFFMLNPFYVVGPGQVGVSFNRISGITQSHPRGIHFRIPLLVTVTMFDVKTQKIVLDAQSASKDMQEVNVKLVLNCHLQYDKVNELYVNVGVDYKDKVIAPAVFESVKASTAKFPVEQIITERDKLKDMLETKLTERLKAYYIVMESANLVDINFSQEFNQVVEQKQLEEQKIKTAQYQRLQAEEKKKTTILEAEGESRKQELLRRTTSKEVIELKWIEKWDGKLPTYMLGDKTSLFMGAK